MIKRFFANKDNTITNSFEENLTTRGTGSNMGASDILETFSIYAQQASSSSELARILIEFPITEISSSREAGTIPASGSVSFYLKMYNAPHSQTVPSNFSLNVQGISGSWEEGYGIDMDFYEDLTKNGIGSNWVNANGSLTAATADLVLQGGANEASMDGQSFVLTDAGGTSQTFTFDFDSSTLTDGTIGLNSLTTTSASIERIKTAINNVSGLDITAGVTGAAGDSDSQYTLTLTQGATGRSGNTDIDLSSVAHLSSTGFSGGDGKWVSQGGDFYTDGSSSFSQFFSTGLEDLCIDVTTLVEQWINTDGNTLGHKENHGFGIKLTNSLESEQKSFFTKKFFGRDSEFFFQRPVLEARWDSARRDDRGSFYAYSPLAPAGDNENTLFLYNRIRGRLRNIPAVGTNDIEVSLYDSAGGSQLGHTFTGSHVSTGIYSCNVTASTSATSLVDVWHSASIEYFTGSISVKSFNSNGYNPEDTYVLSMPNLRKEYRKSQTHRLNLYVREKNWSPNIHTLAVRSSIPSLIIPSASFQLRRCIDDYVVIPYGTGSATEPAYTSLSHDVSGNYFNLDTSYLEEGYLYDIQYSFYDEENGWEEQPYRFKFRVVN